jgi:hypothetical protein
MSIANLSHRHLAVARWLLENPDRSLGDCSRELGYTQPWLSQLIHSDAFQAHIRSLQGTADSLVLADIPSKLRGVASRALDGLAEQLEVSIEMSAHQPLIERAFIKETAELALKTLGYSAKSVGAPAQQNNIFLLDQNALAAARERIIEGVSVVKQIEGG